jgi:hypothetical protein
MRAFGEVAILAACLMVQALLDDDGQCSLPDASTCISAPFDDQRHMALLQMRHDTTASGASKHRQSPDQAAGPHVCILARTCGPKTSCAPGPSESSSNDITAAFLASLHAQVYPSFEVHLINSQGGGEVYVNLVSTFNDSRIAYGPSSPKRLTSKIPELEASNYALELLLAGHGTQAPCTHYLFTKADTLYGKDFLQSCLIHLQTGFDLVGNNFVTRYAQKTETGELVENSPMQGAGFSEGRMDLGAVLVSAIAIQETGARFQTDGSVDSGWTYLKSILDRWGSRGHMMMSELPFIQE